MFFLRLIYKIVMLFFPKRDDGTSSMGNFNNTTMTNNTEL